MPDTLKNIYYLGPDGSNTYNAVTKFLSKINLKIENKFPKKSIKEALEAFEKDYSSVCVLPIENSMEGLVRETIDNFLRFKDNTIQVQGEITLPINHMLLSKCKNKDEIKRIYSHPQALAQCREYLYKNFPDAELKEVSSTSYAAEKVSKDSEISAAIANETCAEIFNLNIIDSYINDEKGNETRFYIFCRQKLSETTEGKTALMLSTKNEHGALCSVLEIFEKHNINMTCIESRPSKKKLGEYLFFIELDGLKEEYHISMALEELMSHVDFIKILGSYNKYE